MPTITTPTGLLSGPTGLYSLCQPLEALPGEIFLSDEEKAKRENENGLGLSELASDAPGREMAEGPPLSHGAAVAIRVLALTGTFRAGHLSSNFWIELTWIISGLAEPLLGSVVPVVLDAFD
jgi:hypothetical protein